MRRLAVLALLLPLTACGGGEFDASGTVTLVERDGWVDTQDGECFGAGGYNEILQGAEVVVRDSAGERLAFGELDRGQSDRIRGTCIFEFTVAGVSEADRDVYSYEVAGRGELSFAQDEADDLHATLG